MSCDPVHSVCSVLLASRRQLNRYHATTTWTPEALIFYAQLSDHAIDYKSHSHKVTRNWHVDNCLTSPMVTCAVLCYLLGRGKDRILVDTGYGDTEYLQALQSTLSTRNITLSKVLVTHLHPAHAGGFEPLARASWASSPILMKHGYSPREFENPTLIKFCQLADGDTIKTSDGDTSLNVVYTPGHTRDSIVLRLTEEDAILSGDTLVPHENVAEVVLEAPDAYLASLKKLDMLFPKLVYPGHGDVVIHPPSLIERSISEQMALPSRILQFLRSCGTVMDAREIADKLSSSSSRITSAATRRNFTGTILQQLCSLEKRGVVRKRSLPRTAPSAIYEEKDPNKIKGPGGLTLAQVSKLVQESRKQDDNVYGARSAEKNQKRGRNGNVVQDGRYAKMEKDKMELHPAHRELEGLVEVIWSSV
ncbi:beta-lactamase-like protein [Jimgerdemannia flammicorona]|uniref:Beta-lactamase-like protein n=2 Tax=Jimgerdemannia flammicorona TaxID=994334 RepID=A0A433R0M4_9FUNG|nr:beta-lactamase-like protein [Jimgerdemannia flammicorona]RUS35551.1 beta-lactamase-like protein [Jimgerdemannia flammicorona]